MMTRDEYLVYDIIRNNLKSVEILDIKFVKQDDYSDEDSRKFIVIYNGKGVLPKTNEILTIYREANHFLPDNIYTIIDFVDNIDLIDNKH